MFNRTAPCKTCPFRIRGKAIRHLGRARAQEIADALLSDQTFTCHGDIDKPTHQQQHCAGAAIMLEKIGRPNQMMRICERLGQYDRFALTGQEEVFDDFDDWVVVQSD